jgi:hypothetical protein
MQHFLDLVDNYLIYSPCCKLFRKEILDKNNIRFDESLKSAEDLDFNLRYIRHISYINIVSHSQYYYRIGYKGHRNTPIQDSDINSMHLIAQGLIELAERMGIYSDAEAYLAKRIAEKHWLSRLPYVFIIKKENPFSRRWAKYKEMRGNRQYNKLCKAGAKHLPISKFSKLLIRFDNFFLWSCYYAMVRILKNKTR